MHVDELLDEYAELRGQVSDLEAQKRIFSGRMKEIERILVNHAEATGCSKFGNGKVSCTIDAEAMRAAYDPELWPEVVKWAVATGNDHIIQRRLSDAKVLELIDNDVPLPDGLRLEPYTKVSIRRSA